MNSKYLFSRLVANAFDFLSKSITELEQYPKYSTIHFYTAVELLIKARLMAEHWSLVVSKRQEPDWTSFISGDFLSVSLDEAAIKLEKTVRDGLSDLELQAFRCVRANRNKAVHFFHEAPTVEENEELLREIVKQQLIAWYLLHRRLTTSWKGVFSRWSRKIKMTDLSLRKHHIFLQVVFDQLKPEIYKKVKEGFSFSECPSCGFESQQHYSANNEFYESQCLVCGLRQMCVVIICPDCEKNVKFCGEGFASCLSCGRSFEPHDLVNGLYDTFEAHQATEGGEQYLANCGICEGSQTVLPIGEKYVCASCFNLFDHVETCHWCNEPNTGNMENSYGTGCSQCEGRIGGE